MPIYRTSNKKGKQRASTRQARSRTSKPWKITAKTANRRPTLLGCFIKSLGVIVGEHKAGSFIKMQTVLDTVEADAEEHDHTLPKTWVATLTTYFTDLRIKGLIEVERRENKTDLSKGPERFRATDLFEEELDKAVQLLDERKLPSDGRSIYNIVCEAMRRTFRPIFPLKRPDQLIGVYHREQDLLDRIDDLNQAFDDDDSVSDTPHVLSTWSEPGPSTRTPLRKPGAKPVTPKSGNRTAGNGAGAYPTPKSLSQRKKPARVDHTPPSPSPSSRQGSTVLTGEGDSDSDNEQDGGGGDWPAGHVSISSSPAARHDGNGSSRDATMGDTSANGVQGGQVADARMALVPTHPCVLCPEKDRQIQYWMVLSAFLFKTSVIALAQILQEYYKLRQSYGQVLQQRERLQAHRQHVMLQRALANQRCERLSGLNNRLQQDNVQVRDTAEHLRRSLHDLGERHGKLEQCYAELRRHCDSLRVERDTLEMQDDRLEIRCAQLESRLADEEHKRMKLEAEYEDLEMLFADCHRMCIDLEETIYHLEWDNAHLRRDDRQRREELNQLQGARNAMMEDVKHVLELLVPSLHNHHIQLAFDYISGFLENRYPLQTFGPFVDMLRQVLAGQSEARTAMLTRHLNLNVNPNGTPSP